MLPRVQVYVDGNGSGSGDQTVRGLVYSAAGTSLLATGSDVVVHDGQAAGWVDLPLPVPLGLGAGDYILAVHAGGADRSARIYGDALAAPQVNLVPNGRALAGAPVIGNGWGNVSAAVTGIAGGGVRATLSAATTAGAYYAYSPGATGAAYKIPATPGKVYSIGALFSAVPVGRTVRVELIFRNAAGTNLFPTFVQNGLTAPGVSKVENITAPAGADSIAATFYCTGGFQVGDVIDLAEFAANEGPTFLGFGDGSTAGRLWDGAANASTSRGPQGVVNHMRNPGRVNATTWGTNSEINQGGTVSRTFGVVDPSFELGTAGEINITTPPTASGPTIFLAWNTGPEATVAPGDVWTLMARVKITRAWTNTQPNAPMRIRGRGFPGNVNIEPAAAPDREMQMPNYAVGDVVDLRGVVTIPPGVIGLGIHIFGSGNIGADGAALTGDFALIRGDVTGKVLPNKPNSDWTGSPHASPSIQWLVPEVGDTYADGPAASTGLTPAGAKLPGTLSLRAIVEDHAEGSTSFAFTTTGEGHAVDPAGGVVTFRFDTDGEGHTLVAAEGETDFAFALSGEAHVELHAEGETSFEFVLEGEGSQEFIPVPGHVAGTAPARIARTSPARIIRTSPAHRRY